MLKLMLLDRVVSYTPARTALSMTGRCGNTTGLRELVSSRRTCKVVLL